MTFLRRALPTALAAILSGALLAPGAALAQHAADTPPSAAAKKVGGTLKGDPDGAIRALGSADGQNYRGAVDVPDLGPASDGRAGGLPRDIAR